MINKDIINDISQQTQIHPAYLEKDWYLVLTLNMLLSTNTDDLKLIFAGGTSLSKGYGIISRFSEDIDFMVYGAENLNRRQRSNYRKDIIAQIDQNDLFSVVPDTIFAKDENRFFNFFINYPKYYDSTQNLRDGIKVEVTVKPTYLEPITCEIKTFIGEYLPEAPIATIPCVSPVETAANKLCGLMWRLEIEYKKFLETGIFSDRNLMRHLHDLSALHDIIKDSEDFVPLVETIYQIDCKRGNRERKLTFHEFVEQTFDIINTNTVYQEYYNKFVETMYYGNKKPITFSKAISCYESLCNMIVEHKSTINNKESNEEIYGLKI